MKFTVNRQRFLDSLNNVTKAINPNSPVHAMSGVLLQVFADSIHMTGSDNNLTIKDVIVPGELSGLVIEERGAMVLDARYILEMIRRMEGTSLVVETLDNNLIRITDTSGEYKLNTVNASDYPMVDLTLEAKHLSISPKILTDIFNEISHATGEREGRAVLSGINLSYKNGTLYCAATDSYRLAYKTVEMDLPEEFTMTIPKKSFQEIVRITSASDQPVDLYFSNKKAQIMYKTTLIQTQLLEGAYPNVQQIIPKEAKFTLRNNSRELERILDRSTIFKDDSESSALATLKMNEDFVMITSDSNQIGSAEQELHNANFSGDPLKVSLNGKFLLQALKGLHSEGDVLLDMNGSMHPVKITDPKNPSLVMIVVPIRTAG